MKLVDSIVLGHFILDLTKAVTFLYGISFYDPFLLYMRFFSSANGDFCIFHWLGICLTSTLLASSTLSLSKVIYLCLLGSQSFVNCHY